MKLKPFLLSCLPLILLLTVALQGAAFAANPIRQAKKLIKTGRYPQALVLLEQAIADNPTNKDAHFRLGICHIHMENFKEADGYFDVAFKLKQSFGRKIGEQYRNAADRVVLKSADFAVKKDMLLLAGELFEKSVVYNPKFRKQGYEFFIGLGNSANITNGVIFYEKALDYTKNNKKRHAVGYKLLKVAAHKWPGPECDFYKNKAADIVGREKADMVILPPYMQSIFNQTYTDADIGKDGNIHTFSWGPDFKDGDIMEVVGRIPGEEGFNAKEILIWRGKRYKKKWYRSKNGYFKRVVKRVPQKGKNAIRIEKNKGIEATVKVTRETSPKPNFNLIETFIKEK